MKNLTLKRALAGLVATQIFNASVAFAWNPKAEERGMLQVTVVDENGQMVKDVPVYIYGKTNHFVGGKNVAGSETLSLPAGEYRVSAAMTRRTRQIGAAAPEYFDRYVSHEAVLRVVADDMNAVVLTLAKIEDPLPATNYSQLRRMGIDAGLIQDTPSL